MGLPIRANHLRFAHERHGVGAAVRVSPTVVWGDAAPSRRALRALRRCPNRRSLPFAASSQFGADPPERLVWPLHRPLTRVDRRRVLTGVASGAALRRRPRGGPPRGFTRWTPRCGPAAMPKAVPDANTSTIPPATPPGSPSSRVGPTNSSRDSRSPATPGWHPPTPGGFGRMRMPTKWPPDR